MILIVGGIYQGQTEYAQSFGVAEDKILYDAHEKIRRLMLDGKDVKTEFDAMLKGIEIVTCNEIGMGIVPADRFEREWRENTGRIMCRIAKRSDTVYRMVCGIPLKIKG